LLGALAQYEKRLLVSSCMFDLPSVRMELGYQWTDFHEILYLRIYRGSVEEIKVYLQSDKIKGTSHEDQHTFSIYLAQLFQK